MATNKWLSDLQTLKATTDTLRTTLRNKNVKVLDTDTLPTLVSKVPDLAPIVESDGDKWQPDPLWKFPDPNGTDTTKTIREIYDEDALASSYTYRGIYQIRGDLDTIDLKAVMKARTNADTFILSDGTTYENIIATTLEHTWDKTKDIIDSKGNRQRYVRIYSNTEYKYLSGWKQTLVWCVHNLGSTVSSTSDEYMISYSDFLECVEFGDKIATLIGDIFSYVPNLKKLSFDAYISTTSSNNIKTATSLKELDAVFNYINMSTANNFLQNTQIKSITLSKDAYTSSSFSLSLGSAYGNYTLQHINNLSQIKATNISIQYFYNLQDIELPVTSKTVSLNGISHIKELTIPENVISFGTDNSRLERLYINTNKITSLSFTYGSSKYLKTITVPIDFACAINLSNSVLLEYNSIIDLLNNLKDLTGETAKTLTLGSTNLAKLTDEEKAIATNKNWTLA